MKLRGISPDKALSAKIREYSARLSRKIVLLFSTLITKHGFIAEKLEAIFLKIKETVTFHCARMYMNESVGFVQV